MGEVAGRLSDFVIATSDNPRSEEPLKILEDIEKGLIASDANYELIPDRKSAIAKAISSARSSDVVLICGKGHETYQILGSETVHFDDREVAKEILESRL
jgi:UDP-N-acetylmuramoyl-L-alanyl-D-glutamate--2,6-diaminopimelate ligase